MIGYSENVQRDPCHIVEDQFDILLERIIEEERGRKIVLWWTVLATVSSFV